MHAPAPGAESIVVRCLGCLAAVDRALANSCPFCGRDTAAMPQIYKDEPPEPGESPGAHSHDAHAPRSPRLARVLAALALLSAVLAPDVSRQRLIGADVPSRRTEANARSSPRRERPVVERVRLASQRNQPAPARVPETAAAHRPPPVVTVRPTSPEYASGNRRTRDDGTRRGSPSDSASSRSPAHRGRSAER